MWPRRLLISTGSFLALLGLVMFQGCNQQGDTRTFTEGDNVTNTEPHDHHAHGPHGGHIVELGGEAYHAEVTLDVPTRKLTVYLLGKDAKTPLPVDAASLSVRLVVGGEKQEVVLSPTPQAGDGEGLSSVFAMSEGAVPESIHDAEDLEGEVVVSFGGTQYRGAITHDHGHDHGHDHDHAH